MIRGILILILSFVALTLQQDYTCTCQEHAGDNANDGAAIDYPLVTADTEVDLSVTLDDVTVYQTEMENNFKDVTKAQAYLVGKTTAEIQAKYDQVVKDLTDLTERLANLTAAKAKIAIEKVYLQDRIQQVRENVELLTAIDSPISAIRYLRRIIFASIRERYEGRVDDWVTVHETALTAVKALLEQRKNVWAKLLTLSALIDAKLANCTLGPVICTRAWAVGEVLLTTPAPEVAQLITASGTLIADLNTYANTRASVLVTHAATFVVITPDDETDDSDLKNIFYVIWARYEQLDPPTWQEIKDAISVTLLPEENKIRFLNNIFSIVKDHYQVTVPEFTCTGYDDLTAKVVTGIVSGTIASETGESLTTGVDWLVQAVRVVAYATFGAIRIDCEQKSFDVDTGDFVIEFTIDEYKVELLNNVVSSEAVKAQNNIDADVQAAKDSVAEVKSVVDTDKATIEAALPTVQQELTDKLAEVETQSSLVQQNLEARVDAAVTDETASDTAAVAIHTTTDKIELVELALQRCDESTTKNLNDLKASLDCLAKNLAEAVADVADCTTDYYQAKLDAINDASQDAQDFFASIRPSLENHLEEACIKREQCESTHDTVDAEVTDYESLRDEIVAYLTARRDGLKAGTEQTITVVRSELEAKWETFAEAAKEIICAFRKNIRKEDIIINCLDCVTGTGPTVTLEFTCTDSGVAGETQAAIDTLYHEIIRAATILFCQHTTVTVSGGVSAKRAANQYQATVGEPGAPTDTGAPTNTGTPTDTGAPTDTSNVNSANTMVFSFVALFACYLVLF